MRIYNAKRLAKFKVTFLHMKMPQIEWFPSTKLITEKDNYSLDEIWKKILQIIWRLPYIFSL